ncbi:hypothetical protein Ddye_012142 [Dipteronia dyeriana]|uniref:DUF4283 domain-containing protein n=1 Tax=Dipteronia dyeriana TaxID=168575 RepID=A0AAE0CI73_9ROSI|nr:hypothetical protein Ddye_012142 [Dipteronia dyeriana]
MNKELSIAPQWIFLLGLPLHLFRLDCLQSFATRFGIFFGTDNATLYRTRATVVRICVEVDLQDEVVECFPLVVGQKQVWQKVIYEKRGFYCNKCLRHGHTNIVCRVGEKPKRMDVLRKEREEKVWKEVGQKDSLIKEEKIRGNCRRGGGYYGDGIIFEKEVVGVVCRNSFVVLSDNDNDLGIDAQKDYSLDPGAKSIYSGLLLTTFVYAKCSQIEHRELWGQFYGIATFNVAWVLLGDFNTTRPDKEMVRGRPCKSSSMAEFNDCINRYGLFDLRFEGSQLSWCNSHQGLARSLAKLDRVLINNGFVAKYGGAKAHLLNRNTSDHASILLQFVMDIERYDSAPFHFQNIWTSDVGFLDVVGNYWIESMVSKSALYRLISKLKRMKRRLIVWNKETFGHVDGIIRELEERV